MYYETQLDLGVFVFVYGLILLIALAMYIFTSYTFYSVAKREGRDDAFLAWIPIGNLVLLTKMAGGNPKILFLYLASLIPFVGIIIVFGVNIYVWVMLYKLFKKYDAAPVVYIISLILPFLIFIPYFKLLKNSKKQVNNNYSYNYNNYDDNYNNYNNNYYNY